MRYFYLLFVFSLGRIALLCFFLFRLAVEFICLALVGFGATSECRWLFCFVFFCFFVFFFVLPGVHFVFFLVLLVFFSPARKGGDEGKVFGGAVFEIKFQKLL